MAGTKINRWNQFEFSAYQRMAWQRGRRAEAAEMQAKTAALANSFASIQTNMAAAQGDLVSRVAMNRIRKTA